MPISHQKAHVGGSLSSASHIVLDVELDFLTLAERIECPSRQRGVVQENLTAILGPDKAETAISNDPNDWAFRHWNSPLCNTTVVRQQPQHW